MTVRRLYLDTNVLIAAFEGTGTLAAFAKQLLAAAEDGEIEAVTSELTLAEVLVQPLRTGMAALSARYVQLLDQGSAIVAMPVTRLLLIGAAEIRSRHAGMKLQDALHVTSARAASCGYFVTEDRRIVVPPEILSVDIASACAVMASDTGHK